ncbi:MAG: Nramp family divalent metal transporter, partial [Steroidobacteraceae bacterium]
MNSTAYDDVLIAARAGRRGLDRPSPPAVLHSIDVPTVMSGASNARRLLAFAGPGFLVAVGYMDPGNWATSLAGGSQFGYSLLSVVIMSNFMAMLLQAAAVRLGIAGGIDLAQACRRHFPPVLNLLLWAGCEVAIAACDLAEVLGMAIGLNLLLKIPLPVGVCITAADVMLALGLQRRGFRALEAFIISLICLIGMCFTLQLCWLHPAADQVAGGLLPSIQLFSNGQMLYLAVSIVGATVMPHNLYLHSSIVQTRNYETSYSGLRHAIRFATIDSSVALGLAILVNAAILIVAAGVFHRQGRAPVTELADAYRLLSPLLGVSVASAVFGIGLLASGLSSSITGTLAGQITMEGFLEIRMSPAARAALTRCFAIVPAILVTLWYGGRGAGTLLVFSQVVL